MPASPSAAVIRYNPLPRSPVWRFPPRCGKALFTGHKNRRRAMNASGCCCIPRELCYWITFLTKALPVRSIGTFIELLIGVMLTPTGFVTDAHLVVNMQNHWTSYYKWLQEGKWSWVALGRQFFRLAFTVVGGDVVYLAIESMFNQLKLAWGLKEAWQKARQTLHRWVHITMAGYGLVQSLSCLGNESVAQLCRHSSWRKGVPQTAGQTRNGLLANFRHVAVRQRWNRKCQKFEPPDWRKNNETIAKWPETA